MRFKMRVVAKTAAYTIKPFIDPSGMLFTNRGASGSVTFTLPAPSLTLTGFYYDFLVIADQSLIVAAAAAGEIVAPGDAAADNVGFQVASAKVGGRIRVACDGTSWLCEASRVGGGFCIDGTEVAMGIAGTALTVTAAELNALASAGISAAEAAVLGALTASAAELNALASGGLSAAEVVQLGLITKTGAEINALIGGAAAGYRVARSAAPVALDGSNPTSVAHGLTTVVAAHATLVGSGAPGVSTSLLTVVINGANLDVYAWKPTDNTDPTLIASDGTEDFNWLAIGT